MSSSEHEGERTEGWRPDVTDVVRLPEDQDQIGDPAEPDRAAPGSGDDVIQGAGAAAGGVAASEGSDTVDRGGGSSIGRDLEDGTAGN